MGARVSHLPGNSACASWKNKNTANRLGNITAEARDVRKNPQRLMLVVYIGA
jgi:hypothetical protein